MWVYVQYLSPGRIEFIGESRRKLIQREHQDWCGMLVDLLSPVVVCDLYEVEEALLDRHDLDWHLSQAPVVYKIPRRGQNKRKAGHGSCLGHFKANIARLC